MTSKVSLSMAACMLNQGLRLFVEYLTHLLLIVSSVAHMVCALISDE